MAFGQRFMIAYDGLKMTPDLKEFCRRFAIGGVILFADNFSDPRQLAEAIAELQAECRCGAPLFVACDHEGGRVQRFRTGFTLLPPMADLGEGDVVETGALLTKSARELVRCGINLNFAPVADLAPRARAGAIGDRAFSADPDIASAHVSAAVAAYQNQGVLACAKHFPGHGATEVDSHRQLPRIDRDLEAEEAELRPFAAAIAAGVAGLMTAHAIYGNEDVPATFSRYWIVEMLRRRMGFKGLVFSDAMEMNAIGERWSAAEAGALALRAGTDIVLYYLIEEQLRAVHDLCAAAERGLFDRTETATSLRRIARAKSTVPAVRREAA